MKAFISLILLLLFISISSCWNDTPSEASEQATTEIVENRIPPVMDSFKTKEKKDRSRDSVQLKDSINNSDNPSGVDLKENPPAKKETKKARDPKPSKPGQAKLTFEKTKHDFGTIKQGEVIEYNFKFINSGSAPLVINNATATCGCTQPSYPFLPVKPNETGTIGVRYNSKGKLGSQKPIITITSNAKPSILKLYLEGIVIDDEDNNGK